MSEPISMLPSLERPTIELGVVRGAYFGGVDSKLTEYATADGQHPDPRWPESANPGIPSCFLPLEQGLNVIYGLNGSGKTRMLRALELAALGEHGPSEGLVYEWVHPLHQPEEITAALGGVLDVYRGPPVWHDGTRRLTLEGQNAGVLAEFLQSGYFLLTWPIGTSARDAGILVPFLPPGIRGPETRRVVGQMKTEWDRGLKRFYDFVQEREAAGADLSNEFHDESIELGFQAADSWVGLFGDSILFNARNLGPDVASDWGSPFYYGNDSRPPIFEPDAPLFLAPVARLDPSEFDGYSQTADIACPPLTSFESDTQTLSRIESDTRRGLRHLRDRQTSRETFRDFSKSDPDNAGLTTEDPDQVFSQKCGELSRAATNALNRLLPFSPPLTLYHGRPDEWLSGWAPQWLLGGLPLTLASKAQLRWSAVVIERILGGDRTLVVIDEPESGLHRTAERYVAASLSDSGWLGGCVVVASHSPEFLDARANLLHLRRGEPPNAITHEQFPELPDAGFSRGEMLSRIRLFLLVEGEHDKRILEALFPDELAAMGVEILPLRGASMLPAALDSAFVFRFTDALVVALVDNVEADVLTGVWHAAREEAQRGRLDSARDLVLGGLRGPGQERRWMKDFLINVLAKGSHERVAVHSLDEPDIIYYLPANRFAGSDSWDDVKLRWAGYLEKTPPSKRKHKDVKSWVSATYGTDTMSADVLVTAAMELDRPPAAFLELIEHLRQTLGRSGAPGNLLREA